MRSLIKITSITLITIGLFSCNSKKDGSKIELKTIRDSASYCLGLSVASNLAQEKLDSLNMDAFLAGYKDAKDPESYKIVLAEINNTIQKFAMDELKKQYAPAIKAGEEFLAKNKQKPGIITTASGLQYQIIQMGTGTKPAIYDSVKVNYHGTKIDGSVFDSSKGASPVTFQLMPGGLIEGWVEALQLVPAGSKLKLWVPQELAYGMQGRGAIQPFETLIFEIELLEVKKGVAPKMDMNQLQAMQQQQRQ